MKAQIFEGVSFFVVVGADRLQSQRVPIVASLFFLCTSVVIGALSTGCYCDWLLLRGS